MDQNKIRQIRKAGLEKVAIAALLEASNAMLKAASIGKKVVGPQDAPLALFDMGKTLALGGEECSELASLLKSLDYTSEAEALGICRRYTKELCVQGTQMFNTAVELGHVAKRSDDQTKSDGERKRTWWKFWQRSTDDSEQVTDPESETGDDAAHLKGTSKTPPETGGPIKMFCSNCNKRLIAQRHHIGKRVKCPTCGFAQTVSDADVSLPDSNRSPKAKPLDPLAAASRQKMKPKSLRGAEAIDGKKGEKAKEALEVICRGCGVTYRLGENALVATWEGAVRDLREMKIDAQPERTPDIIEESVGSILSQSLSDQSVQDVLQARSARDSRRWRCQKCGMVQEYNW